MEVWQWLFKIFGDERLQTDSTQEWQLIQDLYLACIILTKDVDGKPDNSKQLLREKVGSGTLPQTVGYLC